MRKRKKPIARKQGRDGKARGSLPPPEPLENLPERMRRYAERTRERAARPADVPFPEHATVLAGPLRRKAPRPYRKPVAGVHGQRRDGDAGDGPPSCESPATGVPC